MKVVLVQSDIIWEDVNANLSKYSTIMESIDGDADLLILPEMFNTGFTMNVSQAEDENGPSLSWIRSVARKKKVGVMGSLIYREGDIVYNRLIYVSKTGEMQFYNKRHLFRMAEEDKYFTAGQKNIIIEVDGFKIRPLVCYDLRFPVWSRNKYKNDDYDYDVLIYIANWPAVRSNVWKTLLRARAIENIAYVIGVNRVGKDGNDKDYSGDSAVIDPYGETIVQGEKNKEEVLYANIDFPSLSEKRSKFPVGLDGDSFRLDSD